MQQLLGGFNIINLNQLTNGLNLAGLTNGLENPFSTLTSGLGSFTNGLLPTTSASGAASTPSSSAPATAPTSRVFKCDPLANDDIKRAVVNPIETDEKKPQPTLVVNLPANIISYVDPKTSNVVLSQTTFGYALDGQAVVHSILAGNSSSLLKLVGKMTQDAGVFDGSVKLNEKGEEGTAREETSSPTEDSETMATVLAEFGLRSLTGLASGMLKGIDKEEAISGALDCQLKSFDCYLENRVNKEMLNVCSLELCSCIQKTMI